MIVSIGIDIIEVARIREVLLRTPRFTERVYTRAEREYCDSRGVVAAQHYAARFAAKEAALKALQTGWRGGISWQDVEVSARDTGAPYLIFTGEVLTIFKKIRRYRNASFTLTHQRTRNRASDFGTLTILGR